MRLSSCGVLTLSICVIFDFVDGNLDQQEHFYSQYVEEGLSVYDEMPVKSVFRCAVACHKSEICAGYHYKNYNCVIYGPVCSSDTLGRIIMRKEDGPHTVKADFEHESSLTRLQSSYHLDDQCSSECTIITSIVTDEELNPWTEIRFQSVYLVCQVTLHIRSLQHAESYIGCYHDMIFARDLNGSVYHSNDNMTLSSCAVYCALKGFIYMGLQYRRECYCDDDYGKYGSHIETECVMPCNGDINQTCGGHGANSVWRLYRGPTMAAVLLDLKKECTQTVDRGDDYGIWYTYICSATANSLRIQSEFSEPMSQILKIDHITGLKLYNP